MEDLLVGADPVSGRDGCEEQLLPSKRNETSPIPSRPHSRWRMPGDDTCCVRRYSVPTPAEGGAGSSREAAGVSEQLERLGSGQMHSRTPPGELPA